MHSSVHSFAIWQTFWKWFWNNFDNVLQRCQPATFASLSSAYVIFPSVRFLRKEKTCKYWRQNFQSDGNVFSVRGKEEERKTLLLSSTTLALGPAWLGKGDCESSCHGGEQENREERRMWEKQTCSLEMHTTGHLICLHWTFCFIDSTKVLIEELWEMKKMINM